MPPASCIAEIAAITHMMMPMTSNGIASALTGIPVAPSSSTPSPPAKPMAMEPIRAPTTIAPRRMMMWTASNTTGSFRQLLGHPIICPEEPETEMQPM